MGKLFKKALVIILTTTLSSGIVPQYFCSMPQDYVKAATNNKAAKITVKPGAKTLYTGWKENHIFKSNI